MVSPDLKQWVEEVTADTERKLIKWKTQNPTTYVWEVTGPPMARVVLQRVERITPPGNRIVGSAVITTKTSSYLLTAFQQGAVSIPGQPAVPVAALNGQEDSEVNAVLDKLYVAVKAAAQSDNLEFLRSLLPKKND